MRDPDASISFEATQVLRHFRAPILAQHFLHTMLAQKLVVTKRLVPFKIIDETTVSAQRLPFISYPFEWSASQLFKAALLTIEIQQESVLAGVDLKDASAWNVIYDGTKPIFCDLLSFIPLTSKNWWALGQFSRQFILPLVIAKRGSLHPHETFKIWRDGVPSREGRILLGKARYFSRYWPLVAEGAAGHELSKETDNDVSGRGSDASIPKFRNALHASLLWMLEGVTPIKNAAKETAGSWQTYATNREHYVGGTLDKKRESVARWLDDIRPAWVADFGCNTGEFSDIALKSGANVVALDSDHDSIENLFNRMPNNARLFPILVDLDDLSGGRGWRGAEFVSLAKRLEQRFELAMMLALIHHLMVSSSIPVAAIAQFCLNCTKRWLIVELIGENDPQLRLLCTQRQREIKDFSIESQRKAFTDAGFEVHAEVPLSTTFRTLVLFRRPY